jgi:hypothetical protein
MEDDLTHKASTFNVIKYARISHSLAFSFLAVFLASIVMVRVSSASPLVTDTSIPSTAGTSAASSNVDSNTVETSTSNDQTVGTSDGAIQTVVPVTAPAKSILVADNQTVGNATPPMTTTGALAPTTTSGGSPLVGSSYGTSAQPVNVGYAGTRLPFHFSVSLNGSYDDNIYIRDVNRVGDFSFTAVPGIEYKTRDVDPELEQLDDLPENFFQFSYKPEFTEFLQQTQNDFIDQHVSGSYLLSMSRFQVGVDLSYDTSHYPNIDFGGRLDATYYNARIPWKYNLTNRLTLGGNIAMLLSRYNQGNDSDDFNTTAYLDYDLTPKVTIGLGTTVGHVEVANYNPGQNYEQIYARSSYQVLDKISLTSQLGAESITSRSIPPRSSCKDAAVRCHLSPRTRRTTTTRTWH